MGTVSDSVSPSSVCVQFCRLRKAHPDTALLLDGTLVPVVAQTKFLGLVYSAQTLLSIQCFSFITHTSILIILRLSVTELRLLN